LELFFSSSLEKLNEGYSRPKNRCNVLHFSISRFIAQWEKMVKLLKYL
jgi:hypothetical protein